VQPGDKRTRLNEVADHRARCSEPFGARRFRPSAVTPHSRSHGHRTEEAPRSRRWRDLLRLFAFACGSTQSALVEEMSADLLPKPQPIAVLPSGLPVAEVIAKLTELQAAHPDVLLNESSTSKPDAASPNDWAIPALISTRFQARPSPRSRALATSSTWLPSRPARLCSISAADRLPTASSPREARNLTVGSSAST
jgi:hypothetical protein